VKVGDDGKPGANKGEIEIVESPPAGFVGGRLLKTLEEVERRRVHADSGAFSRLRSAFASRLNGNVKE
jgi:hypothetical protein